MWTEQPASSDVKLSFQFSNSDPPNATCLIPIKLLHQKSKEKKLGVEDSTSSWFTAKAPNEILIISQEAVVWEK